MNKIYDSFTEIADKYQCLLFDIYGVIDFGRSTLSLPVLDFMKDYMARGNKISLLSNTPMVSSFIENFYQDKGLVKGIHYQEIVSSEQHFCELLQKGQVPVKGKKVHMLFTAIPGDMFRKYPESFDGLGYEFVDDVRDADFIYCGFPMLDGEFKSSLDFFLPELEKIKGLKIPMICTNPDHQAHRGDYFIVVHGAIASWYEQHGGSVIYFGKPDPKIFLRAMASYPEHGPSDFCMIGDTVFTDCKGANAAGISSCIVLDSGSTADTMKKSGLALTFEEITKYAMTHDVKIDHICTRVSKNPLF